MANYVEFSQKEFEFKLKGILINNLLGFMDDITEEWIKEGNRTEEVVYKITTKNKSVDIIIFSSIANTT